jgi:hypothetical protein
MQTGNSLITKDPIHSCFLPPLKESNAIIILFLRTQLPRSNCPMVPLKRFRS